MSLTPSQVLLRDHRLLHVLKRGLCRLIDHGESAELAKQLIVDTLAEQANKLTIRER